MKGSLLTIAALTGLALLPTAAVADIIDFDFPPNVDSLFVQPSGNSSVASGVGFAGSNGIAYNNSQGSGATDFRIYKPFVIHPDTAAWEVSILLKNDTPWELGNPMIGVIGQNTLAAPGEFAGPKQTEPALFATAQANTLWLLGSSGSYIASENVPVVYDGRWRRFSMEVQHTGTTAQVIESYNIHVSLSYADDTGNPGELIAELNHPLSTVQFQTTRDLYGFFGIDSVNHFTGAIDNFTVTVPEPTTISLLGGGALLVLSQLIKRRRGKY